MFGKKSKVGSVGSDDVIVLDLNKRWPGENQKSCGFIDNIDELYDKKEGNDEFFD